MSIRTALVSVYDKSGIVEFAKRLSELGISILSTGGTARTLEDADVPVKDVSDHTGFPEILDGRVKTLHPVVHAGILARRDDDAHMQTLKEHGIEPIDMVVVNLYPFEQTVANPDVTLQEAIEKIDIGGPTMIRSAAKNWQHVLVLTDPDDYDECLTQIAEKGDVGLEFRMYLAAKAFALTSRYDSVISNWLFKHDSEGNPSKDPMPIQMNLILKHSASLRYGENPHQKAAFYEEYPKPESGLGAFVQHQGKALSFNNLYDLENTLALARELTAPAAVIVKHNNPCGAAEANTLLDAYELALASDPQSAFGGVVALNGEVDGKLAEKLKEIFLEVIAARRFSPDALDILSKKKNLRLLTMPTLGEPEGGFDMKRVSGGFLVQQRDDVLYDPDELEVVSNRKPSSEEMDALLFAWKVVKAVKSNAIVLARGHATIGVGAGQMSRVDAVRIAVEKARSFGHETAGAVLASDGFFPFRDNIDEAAKAGITAIIEPGGSVRDQEVIDAANEHNIALVFTHMRHFKH